MYRKELIELFGFKNRTEKYNIKNILKYKKLIIYGVGEGYIAFKNAIIDRYNIFPSHILDSKFEKKIIDNKHNIQLASLNNCSISKKQKKESVVVVTVGDQILYENIYSKLYEYGFRDIIKSSEIFEFNLHHITNEYILNENEFYLKNKIDIISSLDLLSDELSKKVFLSIMKIYLTHKLEIVPNSIKSEQYFPTDIKLNKGYNKFINCGAFDGDTVRQLVKNVGKIDSLICFEPDKKNYHLLNEYIKKNYNNIAANIICFPCAVYSKEALLSFSTDKSLCNSIFNPGTTVQSISLDNCLLAFAPTFINMDIEGAELDALKGAENLIKKYKPDLAISVYHFPDHLWKILIYINNLKLKYNFYLRNYTGFTYETILYCTVG